MKKDSFTVKMRRTNPGGTRDTYTQQDISFNKTNSYAMDFGQWDGKGDMCFYDWCDSCEKRQCTKLKNESIAKEPKVVSALPSPWSYRARYAVGRA